MTPDEYQLCSKTADNLYTIRHNVNEAAIYEQLAEECTELAKEALKKARKLRGENYTPLNMEEIDISLKEELSDVQLCSMVLGLHPDTKIIMYKLNRWIDRQRFVD